jgi:hypothetical protein
MSLDAVDRVRPKPSAAAIRTAIATVKARKRQNKSPFWSLADVNVQRGEPRIETAGGNRGAVVGTVTHDVTFTPTPRSTDYVVVDHSPPGGPRPFQSCGLAVRSHIGRTPRLACTSRSRGSRRQSGQDPGDPDLDPPGADLAVPTRGSG